MNDASEDFFEKLCRMHRDDPQGFEAERIRLIRETIEGFAAEHRQKAYGLQFKIDCQLRRYKDPVMRMNKMVEIFWEGVYDFQEAMTDPSGYRRRRQQAGAKLLPFRRSTGIPEA
ncbi:MAG: DUF3135 domain-containing protein [Desulfobacteraceae bacterium]|nr:DUF3135 domain-containing protein [Desulfobacteraceae bacterium]